MPRKKDVVKGGAPIARIRENSRLMHTHETMVDFINGRHSSNSFLDVFVSGLLGLDFLRNFEGELEDDLIYSDDDDDNDEDNDRFSSHYRANRPLEPHPRIKQLTDEEADKHAKELIEQEEKRKEKTERNKRKKLRKKEKKRLEKENAVKDILPEEEQGESDSENPVVENNAEAIDSPESGETQVENIAEANDSPESGKAPVENIEEARDFCESGKAPVENNAEASDSPESSNAENGTEATECDKKSGSNKEENLTEINKKEDEEPKELNLNNLYASTTKLVPEETSNQKPAKEKKKKKAKLLEVKPPKEEMPKVVEKQEIQEIKKEKHEPNKEKSMDPAAEEFAKRSGELAAIGNRLAASEQYEMAVKCFTDAIKYNPKEFKLFGNRSLCYERLQQYEKALGDADVALSMEPNWMKGLFRKGKALCGLKRYYEASLIYKEVLRLESSSVEAMQELKRAQTLHLMEMGFTWAQSSEALKTHSTLEEAVEALFDSDRNPGPANAAACRELTHQPAVQEDDEDGGEWTVLQTSRPRTQQVKDLDAFSHRRSDSQSPTPHSRNAVKPDLFSIWVGTLAPAVTYATLHELFSRAGTVYSIKMLLEQQCAFINYTRKEDCDRAIQCINGMVVEGAPLSVRYPGRFQSGLSMSRSNDPGTRLGGYKKECFFWRTTGCTRQDCTFRHVPENKNIDKDKFTSRLGYINM